MAKFKDISKMKPMEMHYYLVGNIKTCKKCGKEKKLLSFFNKVDVKINTYCAPCNRKVYEEEVRKIVLNIMKGK